MIELKSSESETNGLDGPCIITEQMMIDRSYDEDIVAKYNTRTLAAPDFHQRLMIMVNTLKYKTISI